MYRTGPIPRVSTGEVEARVYVLNTGTQHQVIGIHAISLDAAPHRFDEKFDTVPPEHLVVMDIVIPPGVSIWELKVHADPDASIISIYHSVDGQFDERLSYRATQLYVDGGEYDEDDDAEMFFLTFRDADEFTDLVDPHESDDFSSP